MNKLFLMKNPELFQGEKYLNTNKKYFEGWYFKNTNKKDNTISFFDTSENCGLEIVKE